MPPEPPQLVERFYELAKNGDWPAVRAGWRWSPAFARECAHHVKPSSGWGFLHQAAYAGDRAAATELLASGADAGAAGREGETPADVARRRGHAELAVLLEGAIEADNLWEPPTSADLLPSSHRWGEGRRRVATAPMVVQYAGSTVKIEPGETYWVDDLERTLVGWHGTYSPPLGMDAYPMVDTGPEVM
ncbi:hypothetical protein [Promicromonospora sp. NPDC050880]|uniref:hypothetical protein n=1 Tax=Promicromonospora sp. NPDC050880 TaxID=3364406 RepID=UPI0037B8E9DF